MEVTLRISGFFRDAFPAQIELLDRHPRHRGAEEDEFDTPSRPAWMQKPWACKVRHHEADPDKWRATEYRSKPGAYGAGLQP